jgi:hypothetical protein
MGAYAIYTRQSRVRHDITLSSCDVQFQICRDHAEAIFPPAIPWCGTRYDDPGQSGEDLERPALQALLAEIERGTISHVIVYRLDRLSRRLADTVQILDTFKHHAVDLKIVTAPSLAASATSHFMLNILASFAEFEHGLISERIDEVQALIDSRRPATRGRHEHDLPLKGKVFCAACDLVMSPHVICNRHSKHIRYMHYRCRSHAGGRPPCKNVSVPAAELHKFVLDTMRDPGESEDEPGLTTESRKALQTVAWLIDWLSVPDPYRAIGNVVERIVFSRDTIRVEFSATAIKQLLAEPRCDPRLPITGGQIDRSSGD